MGNIFKRIKEVEVLISNLQMREDREGGFSDEDFIDLQAGPSLHHSLL